MTKLRVKSGRVMINSPHGRVFYDEGQVFEGRVGDIFPAYRDFVEVVNDDGTTEGLPEDEVFDVQVDKETLEYEGDPDPPVADGPVVKRPVRERKTKKKRKKRESD